MSALALLGGSPVRREPVVAWPRVTESGVAAVAEAVRSGIWGAVDGPRTRELERAFAERHDSSHGIAVTNGTVSLQLALAALGVGRGDEVIVPSYTFISTATAVLAVNAAPVFVDVRDSDATIDPAAVEAAITPRTRAVIPVHFAGHPADMDELGRISLEHDLALVEDAAQAHGAGWHGRAVGSFGAFGSFSFQNSKNLSAGEGGMLTTSEPELAEIAWSMHHCGRSPGGHWYEHGLLGGNHRMTELQSALILDQLDRLDDDIDIRSRAAAELDSYLGGISGVTPLSGASRNVRHAYHLYTFRYRPDAFDGLPRDRFVEALRAEGIPASGGYVLPVHRQPVFAMHNFDTAAPGVRWTEERFDYARLDLPVTTALCDDIVWLPHPVLHSGDVQLVADAITKIQGHARALVTHDAS